jgi:CDP-2,3-bis-(O-geranylgeranyl)-sn-glycerol synthase
VPAAGASFGLLSTFVSTRAAGLWPLSPAAYVGLGLLAGLGFMAGELPNSFLKRQLDIPSGAAARGPISRPLWFVIDRIDSAAGMMIVLALAVPVPWQTWMYVALIGPALHGLFSVLVYRLGGKARAA